jgi:hypothetical protein
MESKTKNNVELKSVTTKDKSGKQVTLRVREISNGWILETSTDYKDSKGNYQYETKEEYSKENPLDPKVMQLNIIKEALKK